MNTEKKAYRNRQRDVENRHISENLLQWYELAPLLSNCKLRAYMNDEEENPQVFPPPALVFNSLESVSPDEVRVVILSSDPSTRPLINGSGVVHLSRRMTEARQGTSGSHSHVGWEEQIERLVNALNGYHQSSIAWVSENPDFLRNLFGNAENIFNVNQLDAVNGYLTSIKQSPIDWNNK